MTIKKILQFIDDTWLPRDFSRDIENGDDVYTTLAIMQGLNITRDQANEIYDRITSPASYR